MGASRPSQPKSAHTVAWVSVPLLSVHKNSGLSTKQVNRFLAFQGLLNDELARHACIMENPVLNLLETETGIQRLIPWLLPQWALVMSQLMLARQQLMIELLGDTPWARLTEVPVMTVRRQVRYDGDGRGFWQEPSSNPNPAELLLRTTEQVHGWWEACQSLLPELGVLMPDMRLAAEPTRQLCTLIEHDYLHQDLSVALATMYVLENALSNDVSERLRHAVERCQDSELPAPGLRFFDTLLQLARENSALVQHFIEAWYFFDKSADELAFLRQSMRLTQLYDGFWQQFLPLSSGFSGDN